MVNFGPLEVLLILIIVGRRKVSRGETHENQGLAIAGQALGIIGTVLLAVYVTALVVLFA